jgi:iron complex transport system ATP-binding protein
MGLRIDKLSFSYGRLPVLREVSAEARPGRITALIGPNAAGKSTLLRCAIGSLRPAGGVAMIDGRPAHRLSPRRLAQRVAYVPQRPVVSAAFTVRQVVELGRFALPLDPRKVEQAIARMDLHDVAERPYPALSVGQQQRVAMARAVAQLSADGNLLLDEPTAAMDLRHAHQAMRLLRELAAGGATIVAAVHDLTMAAMLADDVWLLVEGRLAAAGPTGQVMEAALLERVFGVRFRRLQEPGQSPALIPQPPDWTPRRADDRSIE